MPTEFTLTDLAKLADVTPRTVRYYIGQGLLPPPTQPGPGARYTESHLERLRLIKKMQAKHLPLSEIRARLRVVTDIQIAAMADSTREERPADTAADYIRNVLADARPQHANQPALPAMPGPSAAMPMPSAAMPARATDAGPPPLATGPDPVPQPSSEPERAQWERISLGTDVELHIRRPLTRQQNKRVERLIAIARQLLEEE
jgi:DNA-binding transcriptional MerR regulator